MEFGATHEDHVAGGVACLASAFDDRALLTGHERTSDDGGVVVEIRRSFVVACVEHDLGARQHVREAMCPYVGPRIDAREGLDFAACGCHPKEATPDTR